MKIDSSFIGMESARRYSSVDAGAVSYHKEGSIPVSSMDGTKSFSDFLSEDANEEEMTLQERFLANSVNKNISDLDERRSIESIKFQCMQYLIFWLFGGQRPKQLDDLLSQNAVESSMSVGSNSFMNAYKTTMQITASQYHAESEQTAFLYYQCGGARISNRRFACCQRIFC